MTDNHLSVVDVNNILVKIHNLESVISDAKNKRDTTVQYFKSLIDNANQIFTDETRDAFIDIQSLKSKLELFFNSSPPKNRKSLKFAAGSFGYNKSQTEFFLNGNKVDANNPDLIKLCADHGSMRFIKVKESLDWANLKKNLDFDDCNNVFFADTGEIIPNLQPKKFFFVKTSDPFGGSHA